MITRGQLSALRGDQLASLRGRVRSVPQFQSENAVPPQALQNACRSGHLFVGSHARMTVNNTSNPGVDLLPFVSPRDWEGGTTDSFDWRLVEYWRTERAHEAGSPRLWTMALHLVRRPAGKLTTLRCVLTYPGGKTVEREFDLSSPTPEREFADSVERAFDRRHVLSAAWLASDGELTVRHVDKGAPVVFHRLEIRFVDGFPYPVVNYTHDPALNQCVTFNHRAFG